MLAWFILTEEHKSEHFPLIFLENNDLLFKDCRGKSYDNAPNISEKYSGLKARIKQKFEFATFVPCTAYSSNLVGLNAAEHVQELISFSQIYRKYLQDMESSWGHNDHPRKPPDEVSTYELTFLLSAMTLYEKLLLDWKALIKAPKSEFVENNSTIL